MTSGVIAEEEGVSSGASSFKYQLQLPRPFQTQGTLLSWVFSPPFFYKCVYVTHTSLLSSFFIPLSDPRRLAFLSQCLSVVNLSPEYCSSGLSRREKATQGLESSAGENRGAFLVACGTVISCRLKARHCYSLYVEMKYGLRQCPCGDTVPTLRG